MFEIILNNPERTIELGLVVGRNINLPTLIYLQGDLGAGKTYLSKGLAKAFNINEDITSPTFTLINEYFNNKVNLYHLDLYRLNSLNSILDLGIEDFIETENSLVVIEWAEKLEHYMLSKSLIEIKLFYYENIRKAVVNLINYNNLNLEEELKKIADTWN